METEAALLAAIAAHAAEDTPRLAYADWLDDHAADLPDPAAARIRAEFIRVQCEIRKYEHLSSAELQGYADLYRRQDAFLTHHRVDLLGPLGADLHERDVVFDRGFVTELRLNAEQFIKHADSVVALKPLPDIAVQDIAWWLDGLSDVSHHLAMVTSAHMQSERRESIPITPAVIWNVFVECWPWDRLRTLNLQRCQIGDAGVERLVTSESLHNLTHLDLTGNEISDIGVLSLVASAFWPRLKDLTLGANPISDEGAFALADAPPTALAFLNVAHTGIGSAGQQRLLRRKGWKVDLF